MADYTRELNSLTTGIRNCRLVLNNQPAGFTLAKCSLEWGRLEETAEPDVRHCSQCNTAVHFCYDDEDIVRNIRENNCIAFLESEMAALPEISMGVPTMRYPYEKPINEYFESDLVEKLEFLEIHGLHDFFVYSEGDLKKGEMITEEDLLKIKSVLTENGLSLRHD